MKYLKTSIVLFAMVIMFMTIEATYDRHHDDWKKPKFCREYDCPKFKVLKKTKLYSIREYDTGFWASTQVSASEFHMAMHTGFMRLFKYIEGDNLDKKKIKMTTPVHTVMNELEKDGERNYTISFFLPYDYQKGDHIPEPMADSKICLHKTPKFRVAVHTFGGYFFRKHDLLQRAEKLRSKLEDDEVSYKMESLELAGYDSPYRLRHRHNEIWVRLQD